MPLLKASRSTILSRLTNLILADFYIAVKLSNLFSLSAVLLKSILVIKQQKHFSRTNILVVWNGIVCQRNHHGNLYNVGETALVEANRRFPLKMGEDKKLKKVVEQVKGKLKM